MEPELAPEDQPRMPNDWTPQKAHVDDTWAVVVEDPETGEELVKLYRWNGKWWVRRLYLGGTRWVDKA